MPCTYALVIPTKRTYSATVRADIGLLVASPQNIGVCRPPENESCLSASWRGHRFAISSWQMAWQLYIHSLKQLPQQRVRRVFLLPLTLELFPDDSFPLHVNMVASHTPLHAARTRPLYTCLKIFVRWGTPNHKNIWTRKFKTRKFYTTNISWYICVVYLLVLDSVLNSQCQDDCRYAKTLSTCLKSRWIHNTSLTWWHVYTYWHGVPLYPGMVRVRQYWMNFYEYMNRIVSHKECFKISASQCDVFTKKSWVEIGRIVDMD